MYTFNISKYDQDKLYNVFCSKQSSIQIVVITTALEMSMNISDIDMIIQWNILLTNDIDDLWQKFNHAARNQNRREIAVFFASY